jgi:glycosyltransferase involved in cell wall biosynthesis
VGYKRVDLAAAAFTALGKRLKIVGVGPDEARVRRAAGPTVELLGWRSDEEIKQLYRTARGFVFAGEEDFGLTPVEAQASGCPVIAYGRGGALETVVAGETGVFFAEPTVAALGAAVEQFEQAQFSAAQCAANARRFDLAVFREQLAAFVTQAAAEHHEQLRSAAR